MSKIEWLHVPGFVPRTWNPITGCSKVSEGCEHCYAERMAKRLQCIPATEERYQYGFEPTIHLDRFHDPKRWEKPSIVFVCSMGDLFYFEYDIDIFKTMYLCVMHKFLLLTKRVENMKEFSKRNVYGNMKNVAYGVSVEVQKYTHRIKTLLEIPAAMRFVSLEPLLGPIDLTPYLDRLDWVIVGGETGPKARPMHPQWVMEIYNQCMEFNVPLFFKQWGEWGWSTKKKICVFYDGSYFDGSNYIKKTDENKLPLTFMSRIGKKRTDHSLCGREIREFPEWLLK